MSKRKATGARASVSPSSTHVDAVILVAFVGLLAACPGDLGGDGGLDDAGQDDAGQDDAGQDDAGQDDGGSARDGGIDDGGVDDGGSHDGGSFHDAGHDDAGLEDAGTGDGGVAGDGGLLDDDAGLVDDAGAAACAVGPALGTCVDVTTCAGASWLGTCDDVPSVQCCADDVVATCSVSGSPGACVDVASCGAPLVATPGKCPGPAHIQCCADPALACDPDTPPHPNDALPGGGLVEPVLDDACPAGMLFVDDPGAGVFCVDAVEASLVVIDDDGTPLMTHSPYAHPTSDLVRAVSIPGAIPQAYIDGVRAAVACANAGKRLCDDDEWLAACRGPDDLVYPYGDTREPGVCNDARSRHPAIDYFGTSDAWIWSALDNACIAQLPDGLAPAGTHPACASASGALDMMGNLHEWTSDPAGTFRGGFYVDTVINGNGCLYQTTAHDTAHFDYSTGFRCCAEPL